MMNIQLDVADQIIKVLDNIGQKFGLAFDGIKENIVPYIQQLGGKIIAHEIATSWFWIGFGALFLILAILCFVSIGKSWVISGEGVAFMFFIGVVLFIVALGFIGANIYHIIECYTFPEKVIMDYIQTFVTTHNVK